MAAREVKPASIYRLQLALLALFFGSAAAVWSRLPVRIPMHFNLAGEPNAWWRTTWLTWLALPMISAATTLLLYAIDSAMLHTTAAWQLPDGRRMHDLRSGEQTAVELHMRRFVAWCAVLVTCTLAGIQGNIYWVAVHGSGMSRWGVQLVIWVPMALIFVLLFRMVRRMRAEVRSAGGDNRGVRV